MGRSIVLIDHPAGKRDDRASRMLAARGYDVQWRCPGRGDALPAAEDSRYCAAVVYGGPESANEDDEKPYLRHEIDWIEGWVARGKPFLGICLGAQLLARSLGARVERHADGLHEIGYYPITPLPASDGFLAESMHVYHWHKEGFDLPAGAELLAVGNSFPNQAYRYGDKTFGLQFHPEVTPQVLARWCREADHMLDAPGAHAADRQVAECERYDPVLHHWLGEFFDLWLAAAPAR